MLTLEERKERSLSVDKEQAEHRKALGTGKDDHQDLKWFEGLCQRNSSEIKAIFQKYSIVKT